MSGNQPAPRITQRLGFQIAFLLAVVLLPLTAISVGRSAALVREAQARSEAAIIGATLHAASRELRFIQEARGTVAALAGSIVPVVEDVETCSRILSEVDRATARYTLVAFVPTDGVMRCSSTGRVFDFSKSPLSRRILDEEEPLIIVNEKGPISGTSILGITHPVVNDAGVYLGYVSVSLPHTALTVPERTDGTSTPPLELVTFDSDGIVLTASGQAGDFAAALPSGRPLKTLAGVDPVAFTGRAENGMSRVFSIVPLVAGELYALGTWPSDNPPQGGSPLVSVPLLFPILMWLASLVVAWFAVERLVIRHVRKLRNSAISFARGSRIVGDIAVPGAAVEIREMADAYESMTETILHDEAELEDMVHQKEVLLREVHHRVKNNLQLIASIMNMQMRRTNSDEAKQTLRGLQDRVMSLATIHRELYQTAGLSDVHSDELLSKIVRQITNLADRPDRRIQIHADFADIRLIPDQAVPLALLMAEAVTNAIKYAAAPGGAPARLWVSLTRDPGMRATLRVRNTVVSGENAEDPMADIKTNGLGMQLVTAFAQQLGGRAVREVKGGVHDLTVEFELMPLADAEERQDLENLVKGEPAG